ncbi:MAG TPA: hypothetical protein DF383_10145, partial [Deltaproteobacteria bacterium]|nr:hypothetical protein [Deltaproteobacteria bacterium]
FQKDLMEYEIKFTDKSGQKGRMDISGKDFSEYQRRGFWSFWKSKIRKLRRNQVDQTIHRYPQIFSMKSLLSTMLTGEAQAIYKATYLLDMNTRGEIKIQKELYRSATLLALGLSPAHVLQTLENRIKTAYLEHRDEFLNHLFKNPLFISQVLQLPELRSISNGDVDAVVGFSSEDLRSEAPQINLIGRIFVRLGREETDRLLIGKYIGERELNSKKRGQKIFRTKSEIQKVLRQAVTLYLERRAATRS